VYYQHSSNTKSKIQPDTGKKINSVPARTRTSTLIPKSPRHNRTWVLHGAPSPQPCRPGTGDPAPLPQQTQSWDGDGPITAGGRRRAIQKLEKSSLLRELLVGTQQGAPRSRRPPCRKPWAAGSGHWGCGRGGEGHNDQKRLEMVRGSTKHHHFGVRSPAPQPQLCKRRTEVSGEICRGRRSP